MVVVLHPSDDFAPGFSLIECRKESSFVLHIPYLLNNARKNAQKAISAIQRGEGRVNNVGLLHSY